MFNTELKMTFHCSCIQNPSKFSYTGLENKVSRYLLLSYSQKNEIRFSWLLQQKNKTEKDYYKCLDTSLFFFSSFFPSVTLGWEFSKLNLKFSNSGWRFVYSPIFYSMEVEEERKCVTHFSQIHSLSEFSCLLTQPALAYQVSTELSWFTSVFVL